MDNGVRSDGTAGFTTAAKDAATNLIWPLFADKVLTVQEWADSLQDQQQL